MHYVYKSSWSVVGIHLPKETNPIEFYQSERCRFVLTSNPDSLLADSDRGTALGRLILKSLVNQRGTEEFSVALESEIKEIQAERSKKIGAQPVLVMQASGETQAEVTEPFQEHEGFVVTFDAVNKQSVAQNHRAEIEAMKMALALEIDNLVNFTALGDSVYLTEKAGKIIHSISFSVSGDLTVSAVIGSEKVERISARYTILQNAKDMKSVNRLFSQMVDYETDRLKAFLSGWVALEILILKAFKVYEDAFLSPLTNAKQPSLRERFLERIKSVMKEKYRLIDKFDAITVMLFPNSPDSEIQKDCKRFGRLKKLRDSISHGEDFVDKDLPVHELSALLRKYILAYVATSDMTLQRGHVDKPRAG